MDKENLNLLANMVNNALPNNMGFCLMVFSFGCEKGRLQYVSNANREDVLEALKKWIATVDTDEKFGKDI